MAGLPLGLSTSWNAAAAGADGRRIVREIAEAGFRCLEVEYRVSQEAVVAIEEAVEQGEACVLSAHNYTPLASGEKPTSRGGDKLNLASPQEEERKAAVALTLRSLRLAERLGARALVIHLGETGLARDYFGRLAEVVEAQGVGSAGAVDLRDEVRRARDGVKGPYLAAGFRSLEDLLPHAERARIVLGLENRYYFHQVPLPEEVSGILERLKSPFLRYWHDIGHAHVMGVLGFGGPGVAEAPMPAVPFGVHIHDAVFIRDHKAPGTGEIPLASVLAGIPRDAVKIVELSDGVSSSEVRRAVRYLETLGYRTS
jgi:sugar phosphate isomerase/epimerase